MLFEAEVFLTFALVMARISGLMIAAPVLGSVNFPIIAKVGFSGLFAFILTATLPAQEAMLPWSPLEYSLMAASELAIGLIMGFVLTLMFAAIQVAGQVMDMLAGFGMMNIFNPALGTQVPILGFFFYIIAILFLLATDGHHIMLIAMARTFERIPLGGLTLHPELLRDVSTMGSLMFYDGLLIAAPVAAALLVAYLTLGFLGRAVPQIQLFVVGFPITIAIALFLVAMVLQVYVTLLDGIFDRMFHDLGRMVLRMA